MLDQKKSSVQILQNAARVMHQTEDVGDSTTHQLRQQGEQIDNVGRKLDDIEFELKWSDKILRGMSGFTGMVGSWFSRNPKREKSTPDMPTKGMPSLDAQKAAKSGVGASNPLQPQNVSEEDKLLDELQAGVKRIHEYASETKNMLDEQNRALDHTNSKVDHVRDHMARTTRKTKDIT